MGRPQKERLQVICLLGIGVLGVTYFFKEFPKFKGWSEFETWSNIDDFLIPAVFLVLIGLFFVISSRK